MDCHTILILSAQLMIMLWLTYTFVMLTCFSYRDIEKMKNRAFDRTRFVDATEMSDAEEALRYELQKLGFIKYLAYRYFKRK